VRGRGQQRGLDAASDGGLRGSDDREHHGAYAGYRRRWGPHPGQPADSPAPQQDMHVIAYHHDDHDSAADHLQLLHHDHVHHPAPAPDRPLARPHPHQHHPASAPHHRQHDHHHHHHPPAADPHHLQLDHDHHLHHPAADHDHLQLDHNDHVHHSAADHDHLQ